MVESPIQLTLVNRLTLVQQPPTSVILALVCLVGIEKELVVAQVKLECGVGLLRHVNVRMLMLSTSHFYNKINDSFWQFYVGSPNYLCDMQHSTICDNIIWETPKCNIDGTYICQI